MRTTSVIIILALLAISTLTGAAAESNPNAASAPRHLPQGLPVYGKVGSIDKEAKTITLEGKEKVRIFYVTPATRVHRAKRPAKFEEVVVGQWIGGYARPDANGRATLATLNLGVTQRKGSTNGTAQPKSVK